MGPLGEVLTQLSKGGGAKGINIEDVTRQLEELTTKYPFQVGCVNFTLATERSSDPCEICSPKDVVSAKLTSSASGRRDLGLKYISPLQGIP